MFKSTIKLISVTTATNAMGDVIEAPTERQIFANKKSIKQSEYYQAMSAGLKPEIAFAVHAFEYRGEEKLLYGTNEYKIIRTYEKGLFTELICEGVI